MKQINTVINVNNNNTSARQTLHVSVNFQLKSIGFRLLNFQVATQNMHATVDDVCKPFFDFLQLPMVGNWLQDLEL